MDWAEQQLGILRSQYEGRWDIWTVKLYGKGYSWCAKRAGTEIGTVSEHSPEDMIKAIAEQEASH